MSKVSFIEKIRSKSLKELQKLLQEKRMKLQDLYFEVHFGKFNSLTSLRSLRKQIAQIITLINDHDHAKNDKDSRQN